MTYQWLLFDADNTLFDFDRAEKDALRLTLEQFEIPYREDYRPQGKPKSHPARVDYEIRDLKQLTDIVGKHSR